MTDDGRPGSAFIWKDLARGPVHGPLPVLLLLLTTAAGVIDAVTVLGLTGVRANMTGNVVFVGFALAGAPDQAMATVSGRSHEGPPTGDRDRRRPGFPTRRGLADVPAGVRTR